MTGTVSDFGATGVRTTERSHALPPRGARAGRATVFTRLFPKLAIVGAFLAAALPPGFAAQAQEADTVTVYVGNLGKTSAPSALDIDGTSPQIRAQKFTTGSASGGYDFEGIELDLGQAPGSASQLTVTIREADTSTDSPSSTVRYTLGKPNPLGTGIQRFTAPGSARLDEEKSYFVHILYNETSGVIPTFNATTDDDQDSETGDGWSIGNNSWYWGGVWRDNEARAIKMSILGGNTAPTASGETVTVAEDGEDGAYTFSEEDFGFEDINAGDSLDHVKIASLRGEGTLQLVDGTDVTDVEEDDEVPASAIADGDLKYSLPPNANGFPLARFKFRVNDGALDSDEQTMDIDVTPVNDAPTASDNTDNTIEPKED